MAAIIQKDVAAFTFVGCLHAKVGEALLLMRQRRMDGDSFWRVIPPKSLGLAYAEQS